MFIVIVDGGGYHACCRKRFGQRIEAGSVHRDRGRHVRGTPAEAALADEVRD